MKKFAFSWGLCLLLGHAGHLAAADLSGEERLSAIRESLVEAALKSNTHVSASSWMDSDGVLKEYNRFNSDIKVRELEVKGFHQTADKTIQADVVAKQTQAMPVDACAAPMAKHKLNHVMIIDANVSPDLSPSQRYRGQQIERYALAKVMQASTASPSWRLVIASQQDKVYDRMLYSRGEEAIQLHMQLTVGPVAQGRTVDDMGSFSLNWQVTSPVQVRPRWQSSDVIVSPVVTHSLGSNNMTFATLDDIDQAVKRLVVQLETNLACEPPSFAVVQEQGHLIVKAGQTAGLHLGDKVVLANSDLLPQRALEAGALNASMLAEVKSVTSYQAEVKLLTKRVPNNDGAWVAWPYTY